MKVKDTIAWALVIWSTDEKGHRQGKVAAQASRPCVDEESISLWENEIDGVGYSGLCDSIGADAPTEDGLFIFECTKEQWHGFGNGDMDGEAEFDGQWRTLSQQEWRSLFHDPDLQGFVAIDEDNIDMDYVIRDSDLSELLSAKVAADPA